MMMMMRMMMMTAMSRMRERYVCHCCCICDWNGQYWIFGIEIKYEWWEYCSLCVSQFIISLRFFLPLCTNQNGYRADHQVFRFVDPDHEEEEAENDDDDDEEGTARQAWIQRQIARIHVLRALAREQDDDDNIAEIMEY